MIEIIFRLPLELIEGGSLYVTIELSFGQKAVSKADVIDLRPYESARKRSITYLWRESLANTQKRAA